MGMYVTGCVSMCAYVCVHVCVYMHVCADGTVGGSVAFQCLIRAPVKFGHLVLVHRLPPVYPVVDLEGDPGVQRNPPFASPM